MQYRVLYTKITQSKRKVYRDGSLSITEKGLAGCNIGVHLRDDDGTDVLRKVTSGLNIKIGESISLSNYEIQIEECINTCTEILECGSGKENSDMKEVCANVKGPTLKRPFISLTSSLQPSSLSILSKPDKSQNTSKELSVSPIIIDASISKLMRPHQIEAANFLISRLFPTNPNSDKTGAVLADEMGLGKTLSTLAVVWSYVKTGRGKCVIVTPSSLVYNWKREINKWFGVRLKPLCAVSGENAVHLIQSFVIGHVSLSPVLIISYELFRKYSEKLNETAKFDLLVCDEGHRLKNTMGTKTQLSLLSCVATKRIILTGTPIQNDLEELYSVVSFVSPNFFGSLSQFKLEFISRIVKLRELLHSEGLSPNKASLQESFVYRDGKEAARKLSIRLGDIMLQRSQEQVLKEILPQKMEYAVLCGMTPAQEEKYCACVSSLSKDSIECESDSQSSTYSFYAEDSDDADEKNNTSEDYDCTDIEAAGAHASGVLGSLQRIRLISSCGSARRSDVESGGTGIHNSSGKLHVLDAWLRLWLAHSDNSAPPTSKTVDKLVIVSNFQVTLDAVDALINSRGYGKILRVDGSTPSVKRLDLVDTFNRVDNSEHRIFLLSAKAGGVGLNLIGANRLILMDCDWNPATDRQATSRIWRDGQTKPVFIYKMITNKSIEQSVFQKQLAKMNLSDAVLCSDKSDVDDRFFQCDTGLKPSTLQPMEVRQLVQPMAEIHASNDSDDILLTKLYEQNNTQFKGSIRLIN